MQSLPFVRPSFPSTSTVAKYSCHMCVHALFSINTQLSRCASVRIAWQHHPPLALDQSRFFSCMHRITGGASVSSCTPFWQKKPNIVALFMYVIRTGGAKSGSRQLCHHLVPGVSISLLSRGRPSILHPCSCRYALGLFSQNLVWKYMYTPCTLFMVESLGFRLHACHHKISCECMYT